jgi:hypothetical protein
VGLRPEDVIREVKVWVLPEEGYISQSGRATSEETKSVRRGLRHLAGGGGRHHQDRGSGGEQMSVEALRPRLFEGERKGTKA